MSAIDALNTITERYERLNEIVHHIWKATHHHYRSLENCINRLNEKENKWLSH